MLFSRDSECEVKTTLQYSLSSLKRALLTDRVCFIA